LSITPNGGSATSVGVSGRPNTARMRAAVVPSVSSTVPSTPQRAPSHPQANLPAAPPKQQRERKAHGRQGGAFGLKQEGQEREQPHARGAVQHPKDEQQGEAAVAAALADGGADLFPGRRRGEAPSALQGFWAAVPIAGRTRGLRAPVAVRTYRAFRALKTGGSLPLNRMQELLGRPR
jgi:hypothetical protein